MHYTVLTQPLAQANRLNRAEIDRILADDPCVGQLVADATGAKDRCDTHAIEMARALHRMWTGLHG